VLRTLKYSALVVFLFKGTARFAACTPLHQLVPRCVSLQGDNSLKRLVLLYINSSLVVFLFKGTTRFAACTALHQLVPRCVSFRGNNSLRGLYCSTSTRSSLCFSSRLHRFAPCTALHQLVPRCVSQ
jgi:hypothetical protein